MKNLKELNFVSERLLDFVESQGAYFAKSEHSKDCFLLCDKETDWFFGIAISPGNIHEKIRFFDDYDRNVLLYKSTIDSKRKTFEYKRFLIKKRFGQNENK